MTFLILILLEISSLFPIALTNNDTKSFHIKDKIDWSKWSTVEGQEKVTKKSIDLSSDANIERKKATIDWSRWEITKTTSLQMPSAHQEIDSFIDWLKKSTTDVNFTGGKFLLTENDLPRKPKVTVESTLEKPDIRRSNISKLIENIAKIGTKRKVNDKTLSRIELNKEPMVNKQNEITNIKSNENSNLPINVGKVVGGINWSAWNRNNKTSTTSKPNQKAPAKLENFEEPEENEVPSFFGWPWWAWLICAIITAIILGLVYISVFWNDFTDCMNGREIFCAVSEK